jgi:hypothetical protein
MPDKPTWCGHLEEITRRLRALPDGWVDRSLIQDLLGVGPRRAQQILAPCVGRQVGPNGLAERETLIAHLHRLAAGETVHYEHQRRRRLAQRMEALYRERTGALMVAAPASVVNQDLEGLPEGIAIHPGSISVTFGTSREALEKLLALAMAIRNDPVLFERLATGSR